MKVEKTLSPEGRISYVLVDEKFNIIEEVLLFVKHMEHKNFSINTIKNYCISLKAFFLWLQSRNMKFYEVQSRDMFSFIDYLEKEIGQSNNKSAKTINNYISAISSFYEFYSVIGGFITESPIQKIDKKTPLLIKHKVQYKGSAINYFKRKVKSNKKDRLFPQQIEKLYESLESHTSDEGLNVRNRLIFRILYESGIRIGELLGMRLNDYSVPDPSKQFGQLTVVKREVNTIYHPDHLVKTNARIIPVSMDLIFAIDEYVCEYRPQKDNIDTIIVSHQKSYEGKYLTRRTVNVLFNEISSKTNINVTPHILRHTHGTELAEYGYEDTYIAHRLGHSSIESTNTYIHLSLESQIKAYSNFIKHRRALKYD